ncbi:MAG: GNAT family N-acetyltransferase [Desulfatibacillaceae bacterium]
MDDLDKNANPAPESDDHEEGHKLRLRNLTPDDYKDVKAIMDRVYPTLEGAWSYDQFCSQIEKFPEGQICIEDYGRVVSGALTMMVRHQDFGDSHTYEQVVGDGYLKNHNPNGDYLYGIDVFVHPDYRGLRLGRRLYDARKELCESLNLKGILLGGRIPGYEEYASEMTPAQYVRAVRDKEIYDPILTFQLSNEFHVKKIMKNYLRADVESRGYGVLLEWINIYYEDKPKLIGAKKVYVRLGVVQWQMRLFDSFEEFLTQVEFFVDTVSGYNADIILFPEMFNAPLMARFDQEDPAEAMRSLAEYTPMLQEALTRFAVTYNINIVSGSVPEHREDGLYNVVFVCRRDGTHDKQYKLHITPDEKHYWGLKGGDQLRIFDTDVGKVGVLICFDVEFPELARVLADRGMTILLVPFWTDTKNAYLRVRRCAQARAIENECYVAMSGSVGNLPKVANMDIQYAHSAIFTPSDFAFPHDAVAAEATPNTEMTLIADLDLDLLKELRKQGSVRNLEGRRDDLYRLTWLRKKEPLK